MLIAVIETSATRAVLALTDDQATRAADPFAVRLEVAFELLTNRLIALEHAVSVAGATMQ